MVRKISHIASGINSNSLGKRVEVKGAEEEVEHLADTFNSMLDRIELLVKEQKEISYVTDRRTTSSSTTFNN